MTFRRKYFILIKRARKERKKKLHIKNCSAKISQIGMCQLLITYRRKKGAIFWENLKININTDAYPLINECNLIASNLYLFFFFIFIPFLYHLKASLSPFHTIAIYLGSKSSLLSSLVWTSTICTNSPQTALNYLYVHLLKWPLL